MCRGHCKRQSSPTGCRRIANVPPKSSRSPDHHSVYVVYLRNPRGDGKDLNPMPYAKEMEISLANSLRKRGYLVHGGH